MSTCKDTTKKTIKCNHDNRTDIEVMQAYVDGEQIEYFDNEEAKWLDCDPLWNWELFDYRAKPKSDYRP